jgi:hypothetical protein
MLFLRLYNEAIFCINLNQIIYPYINIDKKVYYSNKKQILKFADPQNRTKIIYEENSDRVEYVEIHVKYGEVLNSLGIYVYKTRE